MLTGVKAHIPSCLQALVIFGLVSSLPGTAQSSQTRTRTSTTAATEPAQALDGAGASEQNPSPQPEPTVTQPVRRSSQNPARTAGSGAVKSASVAAKNVTPAAAEPALPIVPPPPSTLPETPLPATPDRTDIRSTAEPALEKSDTTILGQGFGLVETGKMVGSVGLILCLIVGGYMLFRRFAPQYLTKRPSERDLRLIESLPMGEKRSIAVVQAGAQKLLLACTPGQITLLTQLNSPPGSAAADAVEIPASPAAQAMPGSFRNFYEQEKKVSPARSQAVKALPPDIRGKMLELRKALEG